MLVDSVLIRHAEESRYQAAETPQHEGSQTFCPSLYVAESSRDPDSRPLLARDLSTGGTEKQTSGGSNDDTMEDAQFSCPMLPVEHSHHVGFMCYARGRHTDRVDGGADWKRHKRPPQSKMRRRAAITLPVEEQVQSAQTPGAIEARKHLHTIRKPCDTVYLAASLLRISRIEFKPGLLCPITSIHERASSFHGGAKKNSNLAPPKIAFEFSMSQSLLAYTADKEILEMAFPQTRAAQRHPTGGDGEDAID
ncbi:hypothetical protein E2P81_ATG08896 [Venturia nashicola]|uniref:Uncharacterized protein n=1 Tax=Venturia nashicola TaxID=86259 RepID=A0A4Z1NKB4_9PEZI|nr:hypothetical protein E6O75_ATG09093 [Venturia nashicola]TLD23552.1 hypothetical protein E2P81_ATG08896 [Venturia nashicola]